MQRADKDVLVALRTAQRDIERQLKELATRPGIGREIRRAQLLLTKRNIQAEIAKLFRKLGDIIQARRVEAAVRVLNVNEQLDRFKMLTANLPDAAEVARAVSAAELSAAASGFDRMIARVQGASYIPLSQKVYQSSTRLNSQLNRAVESALARGLSAREFAASIANFINPATPGGVRYAALRLARTEINNAAHAVAVDSIQDKPWVESMKWNLSSSHPRPDVCDSLAHGGPDGDGEYPKKDVPGKPHPHCFCFVTPVTPDDDDFLDNLIKGKYNDYLNKYRNQKQPTLTQPVVQPAPKVQAKKVPAKAPAKRAPVQVPAKKVTKKAAPRKAAKKVAPAAPANQVLLPRTTPPQAPRSAVRHPLLDRTPRLQNWGLVGRSADLDFDVLNVNPKYRRDPAYGVNCVHVVNAMELRARGFQVTASALPSHLIPNRGRSAQEALNRWVQRDGQPHLRYFKQMTQRDVLAETAAWPDGARGWMRVSWRGGGGHIINVEKVNGQVRFVDGQNGDIAINMQHYLRNVEHDGWSVVRVDDLEPKDSVIEFIDAAVR